MNFIIFTNLQGTKAKGVKIVQISPVDNGHYMDRLLICPILSGGAPHLFKAANQEVCLILLFLSLLNDILHGLREV